jgi:hypothetical protein
MSIFDIDVKNPRFWIAQEVTGMICLALISVIGLICYAAYTGATLDTALVAIISSIAGAIVAQGSTVINSYFKDQADTDKAAAEAEALKAANKTN